MRSPLLWLGVLTAAVATGVSVTAVRRALGPPGPPQIVYPSLLDLGEHEEGDRTAVEFVVSNPGGSVLLIDDIRPSCSCAGLERVIDGQVKRVDSLRVPPGGQEIVSLRIAIRGMRAGDLVHTDVAFRSNAPEHPEGRIRATTRLRTGGVLLVPEKMAVGRLPAGQVMRQVVEVRDLASPPRRVERVTSNRPDAVRVTNEDFAVQAPDGGNGVVTARFTVEIGAAGAVALDDAVEVYVTGRPSKPDLFKVVGRVVPPVLTSPASMVLPQRTQDGPVYEAACLCTASDGSSLDLAVVRVPDSLRVEITGPAGDGGTKTIRVRCDTQPRPPAGSVVNIILRATTGGRTHEVSLPVHFD